MISLFRFRRTFVSAAVMLAMSALSIVPVVAQGSLLSSFDVSQFTKKPVYWPIGITSDGLNLWYSQPSTDFPGIFHITTSGTLLGSLSLVFATGNGAVAWDGTNLWVGSFGGGTAPATQYPFLYQVGTSNGGTILKTLNITSIFFPDLGVCGIIDGLAYDTTSGTIWVSPDVGCAIPVTGNPCTIGFAYQIDTSGNLLRRIQFTFGVSGVAFTGKSLYAVDRCNGFIDKVTPDGSVISQFPIVHVDPRTWAESIAFDPTTFAAPAIWAMQPYHAGGSTVAQLVDHADLVAYSTS